MVKSIQLLMVFLVITSGIFAANNDPVYKDPQAGMFFRDWLLCGPFPNPLPEGINAYRFDSTSLGHYRDYLLQYGGEGKIRPFAGMEIKHPDGHIVKWERYRSSFGLIPLNEIISPNVQTVVYAACVVKSSTVKKMVLSVTSNDGIRIWQNGERILEHNTMGSEEPDRDLIPVVLKKGDNQFCIKISQGFGKWSFQFRFLDYAETVKRVEESAYLYSRPEITETADEYQMFVGQRYKIELLQHKIPVTVKILDQDGQHVVAAFKTNLGETLKIKKSSVKLIDGIHPVSSTIILPDGKEHVLRHYLFVGKAPLITETYQHFLKIPLPDSLLFHEKAALKNSKCMAFQLADDAKAGNLEPMDSWTQKDVTDRYEKWLTTVKNAPSPYHKVFPQIQHIDLLNTGEFRYLKELSFVDFTNGLVNADMARIGELLQAKQGADWKKRDNGAVLIGLSKDFPEASGTTFPNQEAYRIIVDNKHIKVIGAGIKGVHYGLVTLKHLLEMNLPLPSVDLLDFPIAAHRATFQYLPVPMTPTSKARILEYIDLKYNEIVVRSSDYRNMEDPKIKEGILEYFDFIKSFQAEPIPLLWITGDPSWEEGFMMENEPLTFKDDRITPAFQQILNIESSRPQFRSGSNSGIIYQPDKDYRIISNAPPVIERIKTGRIPINATIFFSGDIIDSRAHRYSKTCPSEEQAYKEFDRLSGLVIATLKPKKLHVNHDEIGLVNSDSRCLKRHMKEYQLVAYQINRMRDIIKKHDPDVDMIMWADCVNPYHNAGLKLLEKTGDLLCKDIIMAHWYYTAENYQQRDLLEMGTNYLLNRGFRTYGSPWDHLVNHQAWERILLEHAGNPNFMGLMHTEWYSDERSFGLSETAEVNWTGKTWLTK
ncbi:MAG: glycoside hydrolase family 20 zincin-like fold domain-containing protein [Mariniphaga sp.]